MQLCAITCCWTCKHDINHAVAPAEGEAHDGPQSDQLLLWAVEGLAGVVINGIPNNVPGTRALNTPRAVLWGRQDDSLIWPGGFQSTCCAEGLLMHTMLIKSTGTCCNGVMKLCCMQLHFIIINVTA